MMRGESHGGEVRPCLIGGFQCIDAIPALPEKAGGVLRYLPVVEPGGAVGTLDMVRYRLTFAGGDDSVAKLEDRVQRLPLKDDGYERYDARRSAPGRYAHLHKMTYGESTVAFGVGQFVKGVRADMNRGFVEFNPNKVGNGEGFSDFLGVLGASVAKCELVRYDLAVDVPVPRRVVRVRKDRRTYEFVQGKNLTEYLGVRNQPGRVKVYDKAAELGIEGELTRIELTCDGEWSLEEVEERWPVVYIVGRHEETSATVDVLAAMTAQLIGYGESPEKYLHTLSYRTRRKVREMVEGAAYPFPMRSAAWVLGQTFEWAQRIRSGG